MIKIGIMQSDSRSGISLVGCPLADRVPGDGKGKGKGDKKHISPKLIVPPAPSNVLSTESTNQRIILATPYVPVLMNDTCMLKHQSIGRRDDNRGWRLGASDEQYPRLEFDTAPAPFVNA